MPVYDIDYDAIDAYVADMPNRAGFARRFAASRLPKDEVDTFLEQMKESILEHPAIGMRPSHPDYATRLAEWNHENRKFLNLQELTPAYVLRHFATERPPSTPPMAHRQRTTRPRTMHPLRSTIALWLDFAMPREAWLKRIRCPSRIFTTRCCGSCRMPRPDTAPRGRRG